MGYTRLTRDQMAARVARDIPEGSYVNLGIGLPTLVANHLPKDREIFLHSENGLLGMGPAPAAGEEDYDLINAGKQPVTLLPGGACAAQLSSFGKPPPRTYSADQNGWRNASRHRRENVRQVGPVAIDTPVRAEISDRGARG